MWNPRGRFRAPSRVWFGPGASAQIAEVVQELGVEPGPALLVTDGVVEELAPARGVEAGLSGCDPKELEPYLKEPMSPGWKPAYASPMIGQREVSCSPEAVATDVRGAAPSAGSSGF